MVLRHPGHEFDKNMTDSHVPDAETLTVEAVPGFRASENPSPQLEFPQPPVSGPINMRYLPALENVESTSLTLYMHTLR